ELALHTTGRWGTVVMPQLRFAHSRQFRVLEIGLGTGLNFLLSAQLAAEHDTELHYVAIENRPLPGATVRRLKHGDLINDKSTAQRFCEYLDMCRTQVQSPSAILGSAKLRIVPKFDDLPAEDVGTFDTIFLDAFSPRNNPEWWTDVVFDKLQKFLRPSGTLTTYCASGAVRRGLQAAGFWIERRPGPPGKREMLFARRN
ncbi:MAG: tRNA (5-methylaminomethyl-2-thiouridine)(34)-methyltransferase MnmD, partial [Pseudomonadota bacterium]